jgi:acyl-CoA reductase-like NAD-dependent aldehyde dehydrogenase
LTAALLGEVAALLLPPGVLNIIIDANDLGGALSAHPDVAKITFTGSTATGRKVMASAAATLKRLTLELGGNDVAILLDDADPEEAAAKPMPRRRSTPARPAWRPSGSMCLKR